MGHFGIVSIFWDSSLWRARSTIEENEYSWQASDGQVVVLSWNLRYLSRIEGISRNLAIEPMSTVWSGSGRKYSGNILTLLKHLLVGLRAMYCGDLKRYGINHGEFKV